MHFVKITDILNKDILEEEDTHIMVEHVGMCRIHTIFTMLITLCSLHKKYVVF